jgi:hypothetical protein
VKNKILENSFVIYMSLRVSSLTRFVSYGQHSSDTTCNTPILRSRTEDFIRVLRKFKSHIQ